MAQNLRNRLRRIRETNRGGAEFAPVKSRAPVPARAVSIEGWVPSGFQTLKRVFDTGPLPAVPVRLPSALPILIADFDRFTAAPGLPMHEDLLFFDLETTGLSGGAGTVAFLAAFGRLRAGTGTPESSALRITQYLLLDYPGENDFLQALLGEFDAAGTGEDRRPVVVSYNGKSFDSQILKTRCLMNGLRPPEYRHADLLHPARRLWKRLVSDCSQGTIETAVLGLDRRGDIPGSLAPEIWFSFLKTGRTEALLDVCDHNCRDIAGLAAMFAVMCHIAGDPVRALEKYRYDIDPLVLRWRDFTRRRTRTGDGEALSVLQSAGGELLRLAVQKGCPQAALVHALDLFRRGAYAEGRRELLAIAGTGFPANIRAAALRRLAIDSEWRLADLAGALELVNRGLELPDTAQRKDFEQRLERLARKAAFHG
jgi:uncharacterized protein YprB with RNaseH-like and TPR domain